jgi:hypothetical protein
MSKPHITFREYVELREGMGQPIDPNVRMAQQKIVGGTNNQVTRNPNTPVGPAINKAAMTAMNTGQVTPGDVQKALGNDQQNPNSPQQMRMMKKMMRKRMKKKMERM